MAYIGRVGVVSCTSSGRTIRGGITKKLSKRLSLSMLCISSEKIRGLSLSPKNQGFLGKFNYLEISDF